MIANVYWSKSLSPVAKHTDLLSVIFHKVETIILKQGQVVDSMISLTKMLIKYLLSLLLYKIKCAKIFLLIINPHQLSIILQVNSSTQLQPIRSLIGVLWPTGDVYP